MDIGHLIAIAIGTIFINNFVLARFLGICPYIGVSKQLDSALGMGMAVIFVMTLASFATWIIWTYLLDPATNVWQGSVDLRFLRTVSFILVIASLVQLVEMVIQKTAPSLYQSLGIFLPLITTNCAVLGAAVLNIDQTYNLLESLVQGFSAGIGFTLALVLMAGLREKFEISEIPKPMQGIPIAMIMAGLMSMAFLGFSGLKIG
ncbi:MAG: electron transport complex subunit RsxA [candidate division Zixibacteria bacterium]|nr:electron transport complex subunit RsxA [Candidatus Tariuqbacter arcticus]